MKDTHYLAFTSEWFVKHQKILLWVFNLVYKFFPSLFFKSKETDDFGKNEIIEVGNNHATCDAGLRYFKKSDLIKTASENPANNHKDRRIYKTILRKIKQGKIKEELKLLPARKTVFFTDWNYSKMLYSAFKPMWWAMHYWDELFADRWVPKLSFGFSTLTAYPVAGANSPCDGYVRGFSESYATARSTVSDANDTDANSVFARNALFGGNYYVIRSGFNFTTNIGAGATISTDTRPVFTVVGVSSDNTETDTANIYDFNPAATNTIGTGDYGSFGTTPFCDTGISFGSWAAGNNNFTLNDAGIANINKTGVSSFGGRSNKDIANTTPSAQNRVNVYTADNGSNKPKLVVTYTTTQNLTWSGDDTVSMTESNSNSRSRVSSINDTVRLTESNSNSRQRVVSLADTIQLTESINAIKVFIVSVIDYIKLTENKFFSLNFDGVDDYVTTIDTAIPENGTVALWINERTFLNQRRVYQKGSGSRPALYFQGDGTLRFSAWNGSVFSLADTTTVIPLNTWVFIVTTWKKDDVVSIYYNGVFENSSGITGTIQAQANPFVFGRAGTTNSNYFNGSIDEVRVYNRALSPEEVLASYLGQYVDPTGLVLDMPLDGDALDYSGNNNNGTIYGAVWIPKIPTLIRTRLSSLTDTINLTEVNTNIRARLTSLVDTINLTEVSTNLKLGVISVFDTINLTEVSTNLRERFISLIDTINLTEVNTNIRARFASLVDTINLTEVSTNLKSGVISVFDTIGITETFRADMMRLCKGMLRMDSKQQSYPNTLNDTGINKMKSNQQSYPVPMDEDVK